MKFSDFQPAELSDEHRDALAGQLDTALPTLPVRLAECAMAALGTANPMRTQPHRVLARCAAGIVYQLMHELGGDYFYLPSGKSVKCSERDRELVSQFNGRNHRELARKFNISVMRVRQILWKKTPPKPQQHGRKPSASDS